MLVFKATVATGIMRIQDGLVWDEDSLILCQTNDQFRAGIAKICMM